MKDMALRRVHLNTQVSSLTHVFDRDRDDWASEFPQDLDVIVDSCCFSSLTRVSIKDFPHWGGEEGDVQGYRPTEGD